MNAPLLNDYLNVKWRKVITLFGIAWAGWIVFSLTFDGQISPAFLDPSTSIMGFKVGWLFLLALIPIQDWIRKSAFAK